MPPCEQELVELLLLGQHLARQRLELPVCRPLITVALLSPLHQFGSTLDGLVTAESRCGRQHVSMKPGAIFQKASPRFMPRPVCGSVATRSERARCEHGISCFQICGTVGPSMGLVCA